MSSARHAELIEVFRRNLAADRMAHAFIVDGPVFGAGQDFAVSVLQLLFCRELQKPCGTCADCRRVADRKHPDVLWLEPQKKSRTFDVKEQIRPMLHELAQTSYEGGWKAVVIVEADRLEDSHANAMLKSLEEPGHRRLWLLLTSLTEQLLPSIRSRCQRVVVASGVEDVRADWVEPLRKWLRAEAGGGIISAMASAGFLKGLLDREREGAEKTVMEALEAAGKAEDADDDVVAARVQAEVVKQRTSMMNMILLWRRDVLAIACGAGGPVLHFQGDEAILRAQAAALGYPAALRRVRDVEEAVRRLDRNVTELLAFEAMTLASA